MNVLTLDLGTSSTKAGLWADTRLVGFARAPIATRHPNPDRAEQDPEDWWRSVVDVCTELRAATRDEYSSVDMISCSAARETFACFDSGLGALGPGIVWSDSRAVDEARRLGDPVAFRHQTGVALGSATSAAKMMWVEQHEPDRFRDAAWLLSPRDFVFARISGRVVTDQTLASRTGLYDLNGAFVGSESLRSKLPPVVPSRELQRLSHPDSLGVRDRAQAILGAGDRACEVLGTGATLTAPLVSWGTTASVSVPHPGPVDDLPTHAQVSRAPVDGFVVEAGLSAAGAAIDWLGSLSGWSRDQLLAGAAETAPGAGGLLAFPWLYGARAPWWRPEVRAALTGLTSMHGPPELARSLVEGVAFDVARCIELLAPGATALCLAGGGASESLWRRVVAGVTGLPVVRRRSDEAATVGARLLAGMARDESITVDDLNQVSEREPPEEGLAAAYAALRRESDRLAAQLMDSDL